MADKESKKDSTKKKGIKNIASDLVYQMLTVALGIIIPRFVLVHLGSEANGLVNSIQQILVYVALLEAGVGAAALQSLFAPIQSGDQGKVNEIMAATKRFYNRTGSAYLAILILLSVVYPISVPSEIDKLTIGLVVLLSGIPSVISFFFQGKYIIFLNADGRSYVTKNIGSYLYILNCVLKIALLSLGCGIIEVQALGVLIAIIQVVFVEIYIRRHYKWLTAQGKPDFQAIKQSKNALVHQVAWLVTSNTDTIILTYVSGLKVVSIYTMYRLLLGMIDSVINSVTNGLHFALGQKFQRSRDEYLRLFNALEVVVITLSFSLFCIARPFILPFLELYTRDVTDISYIDQWLPYLFVFVHLLIESRSPAWETISVAGHFKQTQIQPIIEAILNLSLSIPLVFMFGIQGILAGTIIAGTYRLIASVEYSNKKILGISPWPTYRRYLINIGMFIGMTLLFNVLMRMVHLDSYVKIILAAGIFCIFVIPAFFAAVLAFEKSAWTEIKELIRSRRASKNVTG